MVEPFIGEIRLMPYNFAPRGWAMCNGQLVAINTNQALFALLGTFYGGNGTTNFALPDLRGRVAIHMGGTQVGELGGVETVTLQTTQIPSHVHTFNGTTPSGGVERPPTGGLLGKPASGTNNYYAADSNALQPLSPKSIVNSPGGLPHDNMQPYLVLTYCIALAGIFPSRN